MNFVGGSYKNPAPDEENQPSTEPAESSQESLNADDSGGVDLGEFVADAIELVSSFFDD